MRFSTNLSPIYLRFMSRIVCVFPVDESTNFLEPIRMILEKELGATIIRGDTTKEEHRNEIMTQLRELTEQDIFVFMGHGASYCLYGSPLDGESQTLFGKDALSLPNRSRSLLISCRSNDFINPLQLVNAIGFGEIPATWEEIRKLREDDCSCYAGIDEDTVPEYRNSFVNALCGALKLWSPSSPLSQLYQNIQLCITGQIVRHLLEKKLELPQRQGLFKLLYELKQDTDFHQS